MTKSKFKKLKQCLKCGSRLHSSSVVYNKKVLEKECGFCGERYCEDDLNG
jgi:transcription elongation factor Elf1